MTDDDVIPGFEMWRWHRGDKGACYRRRCLRCWYGRRVERWTRWD